MSERTLTLSADDTALLRSGMSVTVIDSDGQCVDVSTQPYPRNSHPRLHLPANQLRWVAEPEGLGCGSYTDPGYGWRVTAVAS